MGSNGAGRLYDVVQKKIGNRGIEWGMGKHVSNVGGKRRRKYVEGRVDLRRTTKRKREVRMYHQTLLELSAIDSSTAVETIPRLKVGSDELENRL